jgi:hypothetical protein
VSAPAAKVIGRSPETFTVREQFELAGFTAAFEVYSPATTPERTIAAIGRTAADCIRDLTARGLDPRNYEFEILKNPW